MHIQIGLTLTSKFLDSAKPTHCKLMHLCFHPLEKQATVVEVHGQSSQN